MPVSGSKRPRRKAKQQRSQQTVQDVVEAAARILKQHGYRAATTNRIAETAGVSVGTLYEYFPNKEAIFDMLIKQEIDVFSLTVRNAGIDLEAPLRDTIRRLVLLGMTAMHRGPDFIRSLEEVPGAVFRRHMGLARDAVIGVVRGILEVHQDELRVVDLDLAAFMVVAAAEGIGAKVDTKHFDEELADEVAILLTLYLTGRAESFG